VSDFSGELASASAAPGGGSAAALAGALGASLVAMVCRLTIGRKNYERVSAELEALLPRAEQRRLELLELIDADANAYEQVMAAYKQPRESENDKHSRAKAIQSALKGAAEVPFRVAAACADVLEMSVLPAGQGNKNAASDAGAAALLAEAGLRAAVLNVEINLGLIEDAEYVSNMRSRLEPFKRAAGTRQQILDSVQARL
jgi:formiminotetrahydrofolate cyclodeaminase